MSGSRGRIINLPLGEGFRSGCLRSLREDDDIKMLEWMHDPAVADKFSFDFKSMKEADALNFIRASWADRSSLHLAIASEADGSYLGTISLKHIDRVQSCAEYAIATLSTAHGTGVALAGTKEMLSIAFLELGLHRVFLDVRFDNGRARSFYRKVGFIEEGIAREALKDATGEFVDLVWLSMLADEFQVIYPRMAGNQE